MPITTCRPKKVQVSVSHAHDHMQVKKVQVSVSGKLRYLHFLYDMVCVMNCFVLRQTPASGDIMEESDSLVIQPPGSELLCETGAGVRAGL